MVFEDEMGWGWLVGMLTSVDATQCIFVLECFMLKFLHIASKKGGLHSLNKLKGSASDKLLGMQPTSL